MSQIIRPTRVNHMNAVIEDYDAGVAHFEKLYGAEFLMDLRKPESKACLINIGDVIFELFAPPVYLLNARYGPHYLGIEYQADMKVVREVLAARKVRIVRDIDVALHTHPADCFGVAFEFWDGYFHDYNWDALGGGHMKHVPWWRDQHPLGLTGLKSYTVAVSDMDAGKGFMQGLLESKVAYEADRPQVAARAVGLQVADAVLELMTPVKDGALQRHLGRYGDGIYSTVFSVRNLEQAKKYFADRKVKTVAGSAPNSFAVPAEVNLGLIFEFSE